ncbi:hypothetical protein [Piscirickettsia litoralis]|uniref:Uncharacterized protein n=1 Tax=Piscirickettsia litoralis TaxID=1891921 RepID=A0ABX2ZXJ7_9GAMM|nr:hypothetical protein [Piscirickettsia litoralis]ODN40938.1 hypothetical protein BGC07_18930 [Piscirickettsia litoralis]ODN41133.1 hypothetical protein BGC07_17825 [Piscirickettsia litoralis]
MAGDQSASDLKTNALKAEWEEVLTEFTRKEVEIALGKCKKHFHWPPSMKQFYELCQDLQPEDLGLHPESVAYRIAYELMIMPEKSKLNAWPNPVLYATAKQTPWGGTDGASSYQLFLGSYRANIKRHLWGEKFEAAPNVCKSLPHKGPRTSRVALSELAMMREKLRLH